MMAWVKRGMVLVAVGAALSVAAFSPAMAAAPADQAGVTVAPTSSTEVGIRGTTNCGRWPSGTFTAPVRDQWFSMGGVSYRLQLINDRRSDWSYALIVEPKTFPTNTLVWVDRSSDGGKTWTQCGPFPGTMSNELYNIGYHMRACMRASGVSKCTTWYKDHAE